MQVTNTSPLEHPFQLEMNTFYIECSELAKLLTDLSDTADSDDSYHFVTIKFLDGIASINHLLRKSPKYLLPLGEQSTILDISSISILTRSLYELYLTVHKIYGNSDDNSRVLQISWELNGLLERKKYLTKEHNQHLDQSELDSEIQRLLSLLVDMPCFQQLEDKEKEQCKKGKWRKVSWAELASECGLDLDYFSDYYNFLSSFAHSDSYSPRLICSLYKNEEQLTHTIQQLCQAILAVVVLYVKNHINCFSSDEVEKYSNLDIMKKYSHYWKNKSEE